MTKLTKPVSRETFEMVRDRGMRPILIELQGTFAKLRLKGMRGVHTVTFAQMWNMANRNTAEAARREKLAARKEREEQRVAARRSR